MKQSILKLNLNVKKKRNQLFLEQMEQVGPSTALVELITPYYPEGKDRSSIVFAGHHAAHVLFAAMVFAVRSTPGRGLR